MRWQDFSLEPYGSDGWSHYSFECLLRLASERGASTAKEKAGGKHWFLAKTYDRSVKVKWSLISFLGVHSIPSGKAALLRNLAGHAIRFKRTSDPLDWITPQSGGDETRLTAARELIQYRLDRSFLALYRSFKERAWNEIRGQAKKKYLTAPESTAREERRLKDFGVFPARIVDRAKAVAP
ncbi:hypothetical protein GH714_029002 [Hevea brasiliensis]|uniref:Uncharacterized protein n=1 Tax=Hevea brasiliensis TaxID=3981 RepID=A0A6A6KXB0_HEVBR|nr:hypothetical protein GH714_029002 [Hevea brasiliensis]